MRYRMYYDRFSNRSIPRSTINSRKMKVSRRNRIESTKVAHRQKLVIEDNVEKYDKNTISHTTMNISEPIDFETIIKEQPTKVNDVSTCNKQNIDQLRKPVRAYEDINVAELLLMSLKVAKKHALTWSAILDIFEMLNIAFGSNILPVTKYMVKKLLEVNNDSLTYHKLCTKCNSRFDETPNSMCKCGVQQDSHGAATFFIELDISKQLQRLFSNENVVKNIFHRFERKKENEDALEDIYDGNVYKKYAKNCDLLGNKFNFSYTINTDGCQSSDSSKISIWPIYMMIHELPDHLRKDHMILAGLWVAKQEPTMNLYLKPFVDQANHLSMEGFKWHWNGKEIVSKLFPLGCCVDSVARCAMLSMKKFNGTDGCTYCEHPTISINGVRKYPMILPPPISRTDESIKQNMLLAYTSNSQDITGIKGPTALMNLQHFDLVNGMIVDFMHACLLGITELYTTIILTNAKEKYYVGSPSKLHIIDQRLLSIRPPNCIAKISRSIQERAYWTASEWLTWLIFYSLHCLHGILPKKYYHNLAMFVCAMNILLEDSITPEMLENARQLLIRFVVNFQVLYGKKYMHYNVHLLTHLTETVKNWGPLHNASTFPFENENKLLLRMKKCNYRIATQIVSKMLMYQQLPCLQQNNQLISERVQSYCNKLDKIKLKNFCKIENCILIGRGKVHTLTRTELQSLQKLVDVTAVTDCKLFKKMIFNGNRYTTNRYLRCQRRNNSVFQTTDNTFGVISKICKIELNNHSCKVVLFFHDIKITSNFFVENIDITHFKIVNAEEKINVNVVQYSELRRPCILLKLRKQFIIITIVKGILGWHTN